MLIFIFNIHNSLGAGSEIYGFYVCNWILEERVASYMLIVP